MGSLLSDSPNSPSIDSCSHQTFPGMALYRIALVVQVDSPSSLADGGGGGGEDEGILVVRQSAPTMQEDEEYRGYVDSDLWDLPSAPLKVVEDGAVVEEFVAEGPDSCSESVDLRKFDVRSAIDQVEWVDSGTAFNVLHFS